MRFFAFLLLVLFARPVPAFDLTDLDGRPHRLADYAGRWVLVNYWATWCPPCVHEMPELDLLYREHGDRVVVLGVVMDHADTAAVRRFVARMGVGYPIVAGTRGVTRQIGSTRALPATWLYDPTGRLVAFETGALTRAEVMKYIASRSR